MRAGTLVYAGAVQRVSKGTRDGTSGFDLLYMAAGGNGAAYGCGDANIRRLFVGDLAMSGC